MAGRKVNANSRLIQRFFKCISASILGNDSIVLPGELQNLTTSNGGEAICINKEELLLFGPEPNAEQKID